MTAEYAVACVSDIDVFARLTSSCFRERTPGLASMQAPASGLSPLAHANDDGLVYKLIRLHK